MKGQLCIIDYTEELEEKYKCMLHERVSTYGIENLLDEEIISLLTGIKLYKVRRHIEEYGLVDLIKVVDSLKLTDAQSKKLRLVYVLCRRIQVFTSQERVVINSSIKAGEYFVGDMKFLNAEVFKAMLLDSQNRLISVEEFSKGTINEAPIYVRNIIQVALNKNASNIIFAHPHPGGTLHPSQSDIECTRKLKEACKVCNINVTDHIIVADGRYVSFAEKGLL